MVFVRRTVPAAQPAVLSEDTIRVLNRDHQLMRSRIGNLRQQARRDRNNFRTSMRNDLLIVRLFGDPLPAATVLPTNEVIPGSQDCLIMATLPALSPEKTTTPTLRQVRVYNFSRSEIRGTAPFLAHTDFNTGMVVAIPTQDVTPTGAASIIYFEVKTDFTANTDIIEAKLLQHFDGIDPRELGPDGPWPDQDDHKVKNPSVIFGAGTRFFSGKATMRGFAVLDPDDFITGLPVQKGAYTCFQMQCEAPAEMVIVPYSQPAGVDTASENRIVYTSTKGAVLESVKARMEAVPTSSSTVTIDVQKAPTGSTTWTTMLTATIQFTSADTAGTVKTGAIASAAESLAIDESVRMSVTVSGGAGTVGNGLSVILKLRENP